MSVATGSRMHGEPGEIALVERLLDELVTIIRTGQGVTGRDRRTRAPHAARRDHRAPGRRALAQHPEQPRPLDPAQDAQPEALRRLHRQAHDHLRHRPGRHRQDLPGDGQGRAGAAVQERQPDHPHPPRGRGRRAARLPARARSARRSTPTCGRSTTPCTTWSTRSRSPSCWPPAPSRWRPLAFMRGRSLERLVHHPRRGAEHLARADEDVPDPAGLRLQDRGDRRRDPGRPAERHPLGAAGDRGHPRRRRGHLVQPAHRPRRGPAPAGRQDRGGVRGVRRPGRSPVREVGAPVELVGPAPRPHREPTWEPR